MKRKVKQFVKQITIQNVEEAPKSGKISRIRFERQLD